MPNTAAICISIGNICVVKSMSTFAVMVINTPNPAPIHGPKYGTILTIPAKKPISHAL